MAIQITMKSSKTYKTEQNAVQAVQDKYPNRSFQFMVVCNEQGRYYPICIGERAAQQGTHFHFVTVG